MIYKVLTVFPHYMYIFDNLFDKVCNNVIP